MRHVLIQSVSSLARATLVSEAVVHNVMTSSSVMKAGFAMTTPCAPTPLVHLTVSAMMVTKGMARTVWM